MTNLTLLRKKAGLTQVELAEKLGVSQPNIAYWESDTGTPSAYRLSAIARILNCSIDELLREPEMQVDEPATTTDDAE
jgi:transcriptional regulator with XRE-family HTH domain